MAIALEMARTAITQGNGQDKVGDLIAGLGFVIVHFHRMHVLIQKLVGILI